MKKNKLSLNQLSVSSFVTRKDQDHKIKGGFPDTFDICTSMGHHLVSMCCESEAPCVEDIQ